MVEKRDRNRQLTIYEKWDIMDQIMAEGFEKERRKRKAGKNV